MNHGFYKKKKLLALLYMYTRITTIVKDILLVI